MGWSFDILSAVIGALSAGVIMAILCVWVAKQAYLMGHADATEGKFVGDKEEEKYVVPEK